MPTVKAFIRTMSSKKDVHIRFRYSDGRNIQLFHKSEILIRPVAFDCRKECIKAKIVFDADKRRLIDKAISDRKDLIRKLCARIADKTALSSEWLEISIDKELHPEKYDTRLKTSMFFESFEEFLQTRPLSAVRIRNFRVIFRTLQRYELYTRRVGRAENDFSLSFDMFTPDRIRDFVDFLKTEHEICKTYPELYELRVKCHDPKPRGQNTVNDVLIKLRTLFLWAVKNNKTTNNPFRIFPIEECVYGTPYYISIEERNTLYNTDLASRPALETQRDIFVFQCLIGCRVSDLYKLTKQNVINGAVEYIARKTKDSRPVTVRVPLNSKAQEILKEYAGYEGKSLLPYISEHKYNKAIKEAFTMAGLTRSVTLLDPLTRECITRPLNEIASSHLARRCFVGNLYKQVKDPLLVGELSGHKEGSRAFARYREIDEAIKTELVKMLE